MKRVWLPKRLVEGLILEAEKKAPLETGGVLAGYRSEDNSNIVVTTFVGPGPRAVHKRESFTPDEDYDKDQINKIFDKSHGTVTYLGDWHTHPGAKAYLSGLDKVALQNIGNLRETHVQVPLMLILGGTSEAWTPAAWAMVKSSRRLWWPKCDYIELEIMTF
ncbi:Mov34/MPN/PAD-1 family protein [Geomonas paludis]|uniref:Mov34/MPN/PAD-1 family protein n=1 Tax=Geomonas paludis TaxID=2740185 RepID=A0ABY4LBA1_9BACT|nr:Mov34/MPN/PAD-1 family protein [Geomonas paludis]UPU34496.1 Mov34/MPN/PAD-1 family protein [Geomonas paludis]